MTWINNMTAFGILMIVLYLASVVIAYGTLAADCRAEFGEFDRNACAFVVMFSLLPVANIALAIFFTGFFEAGLYYGRPTPTRRHR